MATLDGGRVVEGHGVDSVKCGVCYDVPYTPVFCPNDHAFCQPCIQSALQRRSTCPVCVTPIESADGMRRMSRHEKELIHDTIRVRCAHETRGCQEITPLSEVNIHEDNCGKRPASCRYEGCGWSGNWNMKEEHESSCGTECKCGQRLRSEDVLRHIERDCGLTVVQCRDCHKRVQRRGFKEHKVECQPFVRCGGMQCKKVLRHNEVLKHVLHHWNVAQASVVDLQQQNKALKEENEELMDVVEGVTWMKVRGGAAVLIIDGVEDLIRSQSQLRSPKFYLIQGYHIQVTVRFTLETVNVYFAVVRGRNDSSLSWPFNEKVTFTLLGGTTRCQPSVVLDPNTNEGTREAFAQWPADNSDDNGRGFHNFVTHEDLQTSLCGGMMRIRVQLA